MRCFDGLTDSIDRSLSKQLELDMEQQTGPKLGKEYIKAIYCHPAYLTYMQSSVQFSPLVVPDSL